MRRSFNAKDHISKLNELRLELGDKPTSESDFRHLLWECGIPKNYLFWKKFCNSKLIKKIGNLYYINNPNKPIHYKDLQGIYDEYYNDYCKYYRTYKNKKSSKLLQKNEEVLEAVNLLKSLGFEVFAPVGTLYSKLLALIVMIVIIDSFTKFNNLFFGKLFVITIFALLLTNFMENLLI